MRVSGERGKVSNIQPNACTRPVLSPLNLGHLHTTSRRLELAHHRAHLPTGDRDAHKVKERDFSKQQGQQSKGKAEVGPTDRDEENENEEKSGLQKVDGYQHLAEFLRNTGR